MSTATTQQLKKFFALLKNNGLTEHRASIISTFTNGRTRSSRDLTRKEIAGIIDHLDMQDPCRKMRRKVYAIAHELDWIPPHNGNEAEKKINQAVIDRFLKNRGVHKKNLRDYTCAELPALVSQFESIKKKCQVASERKAVQAELAKIMAEVRVTFNSGSN